MISVCIPTYKGLDYLKEALDSVFSQTYTDFEIVICNDSRDDKRQIKLLVDSYADSRIRFFQNKKNLGYPKNIKQTYSKSHGEHIFLLAQDDVITTDTVFSEMIGVFKTHPKVGAITRPYYWFEDDISTPIRAIPKVRKRILDIKKDPQIIKCVIESCGQLSGLCFRKELVELDFTPWVFTAHIRPFLSVLRQAKFYYMPNFTVAVRTSSSQTRFLSSIYSPSPTKTWVEMLKEVFGTKDFLEVQKEAVNYICQNYLGLLQIKNYGHYRDLLVDTFYLLKFRPRNILAPKFWLFVLTSLVVPRLILRKAVDVYKTTINKRRLSKILL